MGDVVKWLVVGVVVLLAWRWFANGVAIGPANQYGFGGYRVPNAGYTFMGPGMVFGIDPAQFGQSGQSITEF